MSFPIPRTIVAASLVVAALAAHAGDKPPQAINPLYTVPPASLTVMVGVVADALMTKVVLAAALA